MQFVEKRVSKEVWDELFGSLPAYKNAAEAEQYGFVPDQKALENLESKGIVLINPYWEKGSAGICGYYDSHGRWHPVQSDENGNCNIPMIKRDLE